MIAEKSNLLQNIMPSVDYVVHRICTATWQINKSSINEHNIILIYDGKAEFNLNNNKYIASKGDLIYYKPDDLRYAHTFKNELMKCYAINFNYICPVFDSLEWKLFSPSLPFSFHEKINESYFFNNLITLFEELNREWISNKSNTYSIRIKFLEIMNLLLTWKFGSEFNYGKMKQVDKVIEFMSKHYASKITLKQLSDVNNISPSHLGNIFKEVTGKSPIDYLLSIRINKAKQLLLEGNSITNISSIVGFSDVYYFSKYFKKAERITPSEYLRAGKSID